MVIHQLYLIRLEGSPPSNLGLPQLSKLSESTALVCESFEPYLADKATVIEIDDLDQFQLLAPLGGLTVVYLVGHGWCASDGAFSVAARANNATQIVDGSALVKRIKRLIATEGTLLLLVDTCEAAALIGKLTNDIGRGVTAIFASATGERAWNLRAEQVTEFSFCLHEVLLDPDFLASPSDALELAHQLKTRTGQQLSTKRQTIRRIAFGQEIVLSSRLSASPERRRRRTFARLRARHIAIGVAVALTVAYAAMLLRQTTFVTIDIGPLSQIAKNIELQTFLLAPELNQERQLDTMPIALQQNSIWRRVPTGNVVLRITAEYHDRQPREIRFHQVQDPGFFTRKRFRYVLPAAEEINKNPGMAYVSAGSWKQGAERREQRPLEAFWIDITQTTIADYLPFALELYKGGELQPYESVLLNDLLRHSQFDEQQLAATTAEALFQRCEESLLSCPDCPAPMTEKEVLLFAKMRGKGIPLAEQWELAARGIDGRDFPWGERIDELRVNAGLPQGRGWENRQRLRRSSEFPGNRSPFGVLDTVGNAGDWTVAGDDLMLMGGELRQNAEDCKTFARMNLPSAQDDLADFAWRVGFRGVLPANTISGTVPATSHTHESARFPERRAATHN
jgi:formylglycine-generating enzyme required for sulfatase activity